MAFSVGLKWVYLTRGHCSLQLCRSKKSEKSKLRPETRLSRDKRHPLLLLGDKIGSLFPAPSQSQNIPDVLPISSLGEYIPHWNVNVL